MTASPFLAHPNGRTDARVTLANEWSLKRHRVSAAAFGRGQLGPYRLGRPVRTTAVGEVVLALHEADPRVVELELLDPLKLPTLEAPILQDVNHVLGLEHRHLSLVLGAGVHDGSVYLARVHRLGRTLSEVMEGAAGQRRVGPGIAYAVAEVLAFLAEEGPHPGACTMGGFDAQDVLLGFDGQVSLLGLGLRSLREPDRPDADAHSYRRLVCDLDGWLGTDLGAFCPADRSLSEAREALRRHFRDPCGHRRALLGQYMRDTFPNTIRNERAFFGLDTLH